MSKAKQPLQFIDLGRQQLRIRTSLDQAIKRVLDHGDYIFGPEVQSFEEKLKDFCSAKYAVTCANGTDALSLVLMAKDIGPGDAVLVPSFTFAATAEAVAARGATPVFVDSLPETFNMAPSSLIRGIADARAMGLKPKMIVPVDLFGLPADYDVIMSIANEQDLFVLCDSAQSFGGRYKSHNVGVLGHATTTSFFPAKPLGCYGDGGAVFTDDPCLAGLLQCLRVHGKGVDKYDNIRVGLNSRLDTIQAAILIEKLALFANEIVARNHVAELYTKDLAPYVHTPDIPVGLVSVYAQYTIRVAAEFRDGLVEHLKRQGIPAMVYYQKPLHLQTAYCHYPRASGSLPIAEALACECLSLPMHPYLEEQEQKQVIDEVIAFMRRC